MNLIKENITIVLAIALVFFVSVTIGLVVAVSTNIRTETEVQELQQEVSDLQARNMELYYKLHRAETDNHLLIRELGRE